MTNDDSQRIMDAWRQFRTVKLQSTEAAPKSHAELLAMLDRAEGHRAVCPSSTGRSRGQTRNDPSELASRLVSRTKEQRSLDDRKLHTRVNPGSDSVW